MRKRSIWEWVFLKMGKRSPENEAVQKFRKWRDTKWSGVGWAGALFHQPQNCQKYFPAHKFIFSAATRRFLYLDPSFLHHPVTICLNKAARLTPHLFAKKIQKQSYEKLYFNHPNILGHFWIDRLPPNRHPLGRDCHIPTDQHMLSIATSSLVNGKMATGQKSLKSHRLLPSVSASLIIPAFRFIIIFVHSDMATRRKSDAGHHLQSWQCLCRWFSPLRSRRCDSRPD